MSYVKTTWANGDVITADKLNNIENGIESAGSGGSGGGNTFGLVIETIAMPNSAGLGKFAFVHEVNGAWEIIDTWSFEEVGASSGDMLTVTASYPLPPESTGYKVVFYDVSGTWSGAYITTEGDISESTMSVWINSAEFTAYEITGSAYMVLDFN